MAVTVIDTIKPKNNGTFPVVEAVDVKVSDSKRLDTALNDKANQSDLNALSNTVSSKASQSDLNALSTTVAGKQNALTEAQLTAVNSGITSELVTQIGTNTTAIAGKASQSDLTTLSTTVATKANTSDVATADANLQAQIDNIVSGSTADSEVINARVDANGISHSTLKERIDSDNSTIRNFDKAYLNVLFYGIAVNNKVLFTIADVSEGDIINYSLYAAEGKSGYIAVYNTSDERVASYGKTSGSQQTKTYTGQFEIPENFSYAIAITNDSAGFNINYLKNGAILDAELAQIKAGEAEVTNARVDNSGITHANLEARLNFENTAIKNLNKYGFNIKYFGTAKHNDALFNTADVSAGDYLQFDIVALTGKTAIINLYNANDQLIVRYGQITAAAENTKIVRGFYVPYGFSYAKAATSDTNGFTINYIRQIDVNSLPVQFNSNGNIKATISAPTLLFTSNDISEGENIYYALTAGAETAGYIDIFDSNDTHITYLGKSSGSTEGTYFTGMYTIPANFGKAIAKTGAGSETIIHYVIKESKKTKLFKPLLDYHYGYDFGYYNASGTKITSDAWCCKKYDVSAFANRSFSLKYMPQHSLAAKCLLEDTEGTLTEINPSTGNFFGEIKIQALPSNVKYLYHSVNVAAFSGREFLIDDVNNQYEAPAKNEKAAINYTLLKRKSCVCFVFDDGYDTDVDIKALFDSKGVKCGFAPINVQDRYIEYYRQGFSILAHGTALPTTLTEETVRNFLVKRKSAVEVRGISCAGWVTPSSALDAQYRHIVYDLFKYGFTVYKGNLDTNVHIPVSTKSYDLWRSDCDYKTVDKCKAIIDEAIANNDMVVFYGHNQANLENLAEVIQYAINNSQVLAPDQCMDYLYAYRVNEDRKDT
ncbi:hypothetical protein [Ruminococcus sp.]|uniref:hypothetical protein n=1 Tax=Ruminococcus sp. TaxID=41978 RepID=UPI001B4E745D|nr:hypothetical protein [Ruminococcus sp.]MBP5433488.1 hypothetical protein [Ruminococcus sp.]